MITKRIRTRRDCGLSRLTDARQQSRQPGDDGQNAHHGDVGERKKAMQPFGLHRLAADAGKLDSAPPVASRKARISLKPS